MVRAEGRPGRGPPTRSTSWPRSPSTTPTARRPRLRRRGRRRRRAADADASPATRRSPWPGPPSLRGDLADAGRRLGRALELSDRLGQTFAVAQCLRVGGCLAAARGRADPAVRLFAAAQALSPSPGGGDVPPEQDLAAGLAEARAALGEQAARRAWTARRRTAAASVRAQLAALLTDVSAAERQLARLSARVAASRSLVHSAPNRSRPAGSAAHSSDSGVTGSGAKESSTSGRCGSAPLLSSRK